MNRLKEFLHLILRYFSIFVLLILSAYLCVYGVVIKSTGTAPVVIKSTEKAPLVPLVKPVIAKQAELDGTLSIAQKQELVVDRPVRLYSGNKVIGVIKPRRVFLGSAYDTIEMLILNNYALAKQNEMLTVQFTSLQDDAIKLMNSYNELYNAYTLLFNQYDKDNKTKTKTKPGKK